MGRPARVELQGGLYHIITRGNDRMDIFRSEQDYAKFISLLGDQKDKLPFYLYAYCLMTNHIHLLVERRSDDIGRIMHRVLSGYSHYFNRRYRTTGHVMQGRHKAVLCQSDPYLAELVRHIHLNPVRAKMVKLPEDYPYSGHRAYLGQEAAGIVDVEPVLRRFGAKKATARKRYAMHVAAGIGEGQRPELYNPAYGILGSEEFVDDMIHRIGDRAMSRFAEKALANAARPPFDAERLIAAIQRVCGLPRDMLFAGTRSANCVAAKEILVPTARQLGASVTDIARLIGQNTSTISRRHDAAIKRMRHDQEMADQVGQVLEEYRRENGPVRRPEEVS